MKSRWHAWGRPFQGRGFQYLGRYRWCWRAWLAARIYVFFNPWGEATFLPEPTPARHLHGRRRMEPNERIQEGLSRSSASRGRQDPSRLGASRAVRRKQAAQQPTQVIYPDRKKPQQEKRP